MAGRLRSRATTSEGKTVRTKRRSRAAETLCLGREERVAKLQNCALLPIKYDLKWGAPTDHAHTGP